MRQTGARAGHTCAANSRTCSSPNYPQHVTHLRITNPSPPRNPIQTRTISFEWLNPPFPAHPHPPYPLVFLLVGRGQTRSVKNEHFCYLVALKLPAQTEGEGGSSAGAIIQDGLWGTEPFARVITGPRKRRGHVLVDVLEPSGQLRAYTITKNDTTPETWRYVRKLKEGETVPMKVLQRPMY